MGPLQVHVGINDNFINKKKTVNDMWDVLKQLFEAKNENRKMALKDKLQCQEEQRRKCDLLPNLSGASQRSVSSCRRICLRFKIGEDSPEGFHQEMGIFC